MNDSHQKTSNQRVISINSFDDYSALSELVKKAIKDKQFYVKFKSQTISLEQAKKILTASVLFALPSPNHNIENQSTSTPPNQLPPTPPTTASSTLENFLTTHRANVRAYEARNNLATEISSKITTTLKKDRDFEFADFLQKSAYNYLVQNPKASKEDVSAWLVETAKQKTPTSIAPNTKIPSQELDQIVDQKMWEENQKVIKEALGGSPLVSTPTRNESPLKTQIANTIKTQNPDMPQAKADKMAAQIEQAIHSVGSTSSPATTRNFDSQAHANAIKQILKENQHLDAATQVDPLKELVRLGIIASNEESIHLLKPSNAPTQSLNSKIHGKTTFNNARLVALNSRPGEAGLTHPLSTTGRFVDRAYENTPQIKPSVFRLVWDQLFGRKSSINTPDFTRVIRYMDGAVNLPELQTFSRGGSSVNLRSIARLFSQTEGLGGVSGFISRGFGGLKNLFGFGKSTATLAGTGAKVGAAVNSAGAAIVGSGSAAAAAPYILIALLVIGLLVLLVTNRGNLDTSAEVRSNYGAGGGQQTEQSKYASLVKTASITKMEDPVGTITYTYTLSPLLGPITVTSFSDTTTIYQESGERNLTLESQPEEPPSELSSPFSSGEFSLNLDGSMDDAMISNSIEITFINPLGQTETISSAAITIIGNPPFCPPTLPPIDGPSLSGYPYHCNDPTCEFPPDGHCGIDLGGGTAIKSPFACQAVVARVQTSGSESFGHYVVLNSGPYFAYFAHMDGGSITVSEGEFVAPGQILGTMDNTGNSSGDHLHYEVRNAEKGSVSVSSNCQPPVSENPCELPGSQLGNLCN